MRQKGVVFSTALSMTQCADVFRHAAQAARGPGAMIGEFAAKLRGNDHSGFFTPTFDSPFAAVDRVPDFAVGAYIGKLIGGGDGAGTAVHMYVDDKAERRDVQIVSPHTLTGGMRSARLARTIFDAFQSADPRLVVTDGNL